MKDPPGKINTFVRGCEEVPTVGIYLFIISNQFNWIHFQAVRRCY